MQVIDDFLRKWETSDKPYLIHGEIVLSYHRAFSLVRDMSEMLVLNGAANQNVAIFAQNSPEYIIAYFAIIASKSTNIPINVKLTDIEVKSELNYCDCNWIIAQSKYINRLMQIEKEVKVGIIEISEDCNASIIKYPQNFVQRINTSEVAVMLHTSGTTGKPKKVMLTHENLMANTYSNIKSLKLTKNDIVLVALPLFFGYCHTAQFLTHTRLGGTIIIYDQPIFTAKYFSNLIQKHSITCFTGVPTMLAMIDGFKYLGNYKLESLRYICFGGGSVSLDMLTSLMKKLPETGLVQTYGQTECSPRVTALLPKDSKRKIGSVGKSIPDVEVEIVKEDGELACTNEIGEIRVRGKNATPGYYKRRDETLKILKNGWLYTGDLARCDEEGYIYMVGRRKNVIISGGMNIYPEEIEEVLKGFPGIEEAYVIGERHELLGEVPVAFIVEKEATLKNHHDKLRKYCIQHLADYKIPVRFETVEELPQTATGKIKRGLVKV